MNPIWQQGFRDVHGGNFRSVSNRAREIEGCPELSAEYAALTALEASIIPSIQDPSGNSTFWAFLSASNESYAREHYEKIANFVQNTRDIDVCEVQVLESMARELDVDTKRYLNYEYPKELKKLIDLFSVKKDLFLNPEVLLLFRSLEWIDDNFLSDQLTGTMEGYDFIPSGDGGICNADLALNLAAGGLSGEELSNAINRFGITYEWDKNELNSLTTDETSGTYKIISDDDFIEIMERALSGQLINVLLSCDSEHGLYLDRLAARDGAATPEDSAAIEELKRELGIKESFRAKVEADKIEAKITRIEDYNNYEQQVIEAEFAERAEQKNNSYVSKFLYEREKKVREYVSLIEDINIYSSDLVSGTLLCLENEEVNSFFDVYPPTNPLSGTPVSGDMIENTVHILRNNCLAISYARDYLKQTSQKHAIIGTATVITNVIKEHLYRYFAPAETWRYYEFTDPINPSLSARAALNNLSGDIADVRIIEYFDTTEYMNISAFTDLPTGPIVNGRYWEGDMLQNAIDQSEHTEAEILQFYQNAGFGNNANWVEVSGLLAEIYDSGAVPQTNYASYETALPPESSGTFGTFGQWSYDAVAMTGCISADVEPIIDYIENSETSAWQLSPLISSVATDEFKGNWALVPVVSTWQNDPEVSAESFLDPDYVQQWISDTFDVSAWINENQSTNRWKLSPLIATWATDIFKEEWDKTYLNNNSNSLSAIENVWRAYSTLTDNVYGWQQNLFFVRAVELPEISGGFGGFPTEEQWLSSNFITPFVGTPFTSGIVGNDFVVEDDWNTSPFVSTWLQEPFTLSLLNQEDIETCYNTKADMLSALVAVSAIPPLDGGLNQESYFSGESLSGLFFKYNGLSGENPSINIKNQVHPTWAITPFIWNLKEILAATEKCFEDLVNNPLLLDSIYKQDILNRINECGSTILSWRKGNDEFTGYITEFEDSPNIDFIENENSYIDRDGPWIWEALSALIDDPDIFLSGVVDGTSPFYNQVTIEPFDRDRLINQLQVYTNEIYALSSQVIYQFATDQFGNQYTLFKEDREFDTPGKVWMRIKNHPLSFPLIGYNPLSGKFDPCNIETDYNYSQVDINANSIRELGSVVNKCYDFNFMANRMFIAFGGDCPSEVDVCVPQAISGFVSLVDLKYREFEDENDIIKFTAIKDDDIIFEGWQVDENEKFIGWYDQEDDVVLAVVRKDNLMDSFSAEVSGNLILSGITFEEYLNEIDSPSYLTPVNNISVWKSMSVSGQTLYSGVIKYNVYNKSSKTKTDIETFSNVYDEYTFPYCDERFHNQWKLGHSTDRVTHAYEFGTVSGAFYTYQASGCVGTFDPRLNSTCGIRKNGIATITQTTTNEIPQGHGEPFIDNFYKYTRATFQGLNSCDSIGTAVPDMYSLTLSASASFIIDATSGLLINDDNCNRVDADDCVDRGVTIDESPYYGIIDLSGDGGFTYTLTSSAEQYSEFDYKNWKRTAHGTFTPLSAGEYPICVDPGETQFIYSSPSALLSLPPNHPLQAIQFDDINKEFIATDRIPYFIALHSDKRKEEWILNTTMFSDTSGRGGAGILLASCEDTTDLVTDPFTLEQHPRVHTLSVIRYLGGNISGSCSEPDCYAHIGSDASSPSGALTWAIVYNRMQSDEKLITTLSAGTFVDNCSDFIAPSGWSSISGGIMFEASRNCNKIRTRVTPINTPVHAALSYELEIDLTENPCLEKFQGYSSYGFVVHNQENVAFGDVPQGIVYDRFAYNYYDKEIDVHCGIALVDLEIDISDAQFDLTVNKVAEDNNTNIETEEGDNKVLESP
jgi:hypothetical protein